MEVQFLRSFEKDLSKLKDAAVKRKLLALVDQMSSARSLRTIAEVKKLAGHKEAFRLRIGAYRLGFFCDGRTVQLARILHRSEIYRLWP